MSLSNLELATIFDRVADLLEFQNANPFRVRAYRSAARTIEDHPTALARVVNDGKEKLTDLPGIVRRYGRKNHDPGADRQVAPCSKNCSPRFRLVYSIC